MRALLITLAMSPLLCLACADGSSSASDDTVRVPVTDLVDPEVALPENAGGVDFGEDAPPADLAFCDAFATVPVRWVDDAVVAVQYWVDAFDHARVDAPDAAAEPIDRLLDYGQHNLDWHFSRVEDRPVWTSAEAGAARAIADVAVTECPDLPLVVGPPGRSDTPGSWVDASPEEVTEWCQSHLDDVAEGIDWYRAEFGSAPLHQQQIETAATEVIYRLIDETGEYPDAFLYVSSDYVGVGPDGEPMPVVDGACDL